MQRIIAIDPGSEISAFVVWNGESIEASNICSNEEVLNYLRTWPKAPIPLAIEKVMCYGMAVGETTFETVYWSGRFAEAYGCTVARIPRLQIKLHLCHDSKAKDANIRQALIDRWGGKDRAIGKKANPGVFYGVHSHLWAALALSVTYWDQLFNSAGEYRDRQLAGVTA